MRSLPNRPVTALPPSTHAAVADEGSWQSIGSAATANWSDGPVPGVAAVGAGGRRTRSRSAAAPVQAVSARAASMAVASLPG
jgi:hypothetical protein